MHPRFHSFNVFMRYKFLSAISLGFVGSAKTPDIPPLTAYRIPPVFDATTGIPQAFASK